LVESSAKVRPWRNAVVAAVVDAKVPRLEGAVQVVVTFYLPRPKSEPKRWTWPARRPDLDKLLRATLDGLADGSAFADDAQVVIVHAVKVWADDRGSGASVQVESLANVTWEQVA
jgi:crossover junction endodeoxyribonuclease RusA